MRRLRFIEKSCFVSKTSESINRMPERCLEEKLFIFIMQKKKKKNVNEIKVLQTEHCV